MLKKIKNRVLNIIYLNRVCKKVKLYIISNVLFECNNSETRKNTRIAIKSILQSYHNLGLTEVYTGCNMELNSPAVIDAHVLVFIFGYIYKGIVNDFIGTVSPSGIKFEKF